MKRLSAKYLKCNNMIGNGQYYSHNTRKARCAIFNVDIGDSSLFTPDTDTDGQTTEINITYIARDRSNWSCFMNTIKFLCIVQRFISLAGSEVLVRSVVKYFSVEMLFI